MSETSVKVTVAGKALSASDLTLIRSVDVSEAMHAQTQISIVVTCNVNNASNWSTPLDSLVAPFEPFQVEIDRGADSLVVPARATSASWLLQAGALSTLTIAGLDASADLDRVEQERSWGGMSDADIARALLSPGQGGPFVAAPQVGTTPAPHSTDKFTAHQRGTDWSYLRALARNNDFDVYLTSEKGTVFGVFGRIDPLAAPQCPPLDLGYGSLGGTANVEVQLVTGQRVRFTYGKDGQRQVAEDAGTGHAMGTQSLGGATTVLRDERDLHGTQAPAIAAQALAESSAFGASLSVTLATPDMPLVRARRTVTVRGLGPLVSGLWLVQSVRHTVTQGGHVQAVTMTRNALGDGTAAAALAGAL